MSACWARFVILDDVEGDARKLAQRLHQIFSKVDLVVEVTITKTAAEARRALALHPDFFICDVNLGTAGSSAGLEVISNYKPEFPHIGFLAITMDFAQLQHLMELTVQPDLILSKVSMISVNDEGFDDYLLGYFILNRRQNRGLRISRANAVDRILMRALGWQSFESQLFECLVKQVFKGFDLRLDASHFARSGERTKAKPRVDPKDLFLGEIVEHVKIMPMKQGKSGSAVFLAQPRFGDRPYPVSLILKFCKIDDFLRETTNYSRYVKWMLPHTWRVDILGEGISDRVGLLAYSLAFEGSAEAKTLAEHMEEGDTGTVISFLRQAFSTQNQTWYSAKGLARGRNLSQDLLALYFSTDARVLTKYLGKLKGWLEDSPAFFEIYSTRRSGALDAFVAKVKALTIQSETLADYETCLCHGDLHGGNIMVPKGQPMRTNGTESALDFALIDFQNTGPGYIGTDFVVFENSIRKDGTFPLGMSTREYYEVERQGLLDSLNAAGVLDDPAQEANNEAERRSLLYLTRFVRAAFWRNFEKPNLEHYVFDLFIFTLSRLESSVKEDVPKDVMVAFFCAVVDALTDYRAGGSCGKRATHG